MMKLKMMAEYGSPEEMDTAAAILSLLRDRHLFMCTLLVFNVFCSESLPVFLEELIPSWLSLILSVSAVLLFGEVLPAAIFTGPSQLLIARKLSGGALFCVFLKCRHVDNRHKFS